MLKCGYSFFYISEIFLYYITLHYGFYVSYVKKKSPANAKGNAQQRCIIESPVRT